MTKQAEAPLRSRLGEISQDVLQRGREMAGLGREIWLARLGALATIDDDGRGVFDRMVERGKEVESRRRARLGARREKVALAFGENVHEPLVGALQRAGVSTREEMLDLATRVEALTRHVDGRVIRLTGGTAPAEPAVAAEAKELQVFEVVAWGKGWAVDRVGRERAISLHTTKEEALERRRSLAHENLPSRLDVYKQDGAAQDSFTYPGSNASVA